MRRPSVLTRHHFAGGSSTWKYTTDDLNALLARIAADECNPPLTLAA